EIRSELQDVDYAEAISNLSFQSFVLQAAQQSFAQVSRLSLFDRL
ncbi:MAG TPA: flagellar hook-associated protein 3, partial [Marinobacter sp.]